MPLPKQAWARLLEETDVFKQTELRDEVVAGLGRKDTEALVAKCRNGSPAERYAAVGVLMELARRPGNRFPASLRRDWADVVTSFAREQFPNTPLGVRSFQAWRELDRGAAESYLVDDFPLENARAESGLLFVIGQLRAFGSERAGRKLRKMKDLAPTGKVAEELEAALGVLEPPTKERLAALAREWRAKRTGPALDRLFSALMKGKSPGTVPIEEVIELLGPPTNRLKRTLYYEPALVIEVDKNQRVVGFHFA
jgi:hypothetical protein